MVAGAGERSPMIVIRFPTFVQVMASGDVHPTFYCTLKSLLIFTSILPISPCTGEKLNVNSVSPP